MTLFERFKKLIACFILFAFIPSQAWAQGIVIPSGSSLNIKDGQLTIKNITNAGTLSATTGNINLGGNWTNTGTFNGGTGSVILTGTNQVISGTTIFSNFNKVVNTADTITFDHSGKQTFTKGLVMHGANGQLLSIVSDAPPQKAKLSLNPAGTQLIQYVNVNDSDAGIVNTDQTLIARNSLSNGNTINWDINNASLTWTGAVSTDWTNPANWSPMLAPISGDSVTILKSTPGSFQPILPADTTLTALTIGSSTDSAASLTLNGHNLTVTGAFTNYGTAIINGNETLSLTMDSAEGTFEYLGLGNGSSASHTLTINGASSNLSFYNLIINDTSDTDQFNTSGTLTINGSLSVLSGAFDTSGVSNLSVGSSALVGSSGNFVAPGTGAASFTIGGNLTVNNGGTFNNSGGAVTFVNNAITSTITGNITFANFNVNTGDKKIYFAAGSTQTITGNFNVSGTTRTNPVSLLSTVSGNSWNLVLPTTTTAQFLMVQDSNALTHTITCTDCDDIDPPVGENLKNTHFNDNTNWIFTDLYIYAPNFGTSPTIPPTNTIIGVGPPNTQVTIKQADGSVVATVTTDSFGGFSVYNTVPLNTGGNSLLPITGSDVGLVSPVVVQASQQAPPDQVPVITSLMQGAIVRGGSPQIKGQAAPGANVTLQALDANSNLIINLGTAVADANGNFTIIPTNPIQIPNSNQDNPGKANFLTVVANGVASYPKIQIFLTDPFGVVFDSSTNNPIKGAIITFYKVDGPNSSHVAKPSVCQNNDPSLVTVQNDLSCTDTNPIITDQTGEYSFEAYPGEYYFTVQALGYSYPSTRTSFPAGRVFTNNAGYKHDTFTVANQVLNIDQPLDANVMLLRIVKTANKSEAHVGDVVTYTVTIQNLSGTNYVYNSFINDNIPPGFKYVKNRVLLNGLPLAEPSGQRPLMFNIGTIAPSATVTLEYQLVIGSGVNIGNYRNTAVAQYVDGEIISNHASTNVRIIPDPIFDLGNVIGKVFFDWNGNGIQDPPYYDTFSRQTVIEKPVPNAQIVMEDGTVITTDRDGKYNIPGLLPGRHLFRLDERTLPPGAYLTTDKAVIVDVTAGGISKVNFGVNIDESQAKSRDAVFFNEKIALTQDRNRPVPRLNAALFNSSANAKPNTEEVLLHEGALVRQAEFRIFTNYSPFISSWHLDILDADTRKIIRRFDGTPLNINDPIYWNGRDDKDIIIYPEHKYSYILTVTDKKGVSDDTKENPITVREIKDEVILKNERDESKDVLKDRADRYRKWLDAQAVVNNLNHQLMYIQGETINLNRQGTDVRSLRVMKGSDIFVDIPLSEQYGLTPEELVAGGFSKADEKDNLEIILPNGDYSLDVTSVKYDEETASKNQKVEPSSGQLPPETGMPSRTATNTPAGTFEHYGRPLKVGDDYMMFVALGDAQAGYNIDRGNIEPIQDDTLKPGFYKQGKGAYYLKGQILGKYLVTSSFDSDRAQKALFRQLDPNVYYPVYGDQSSINYDATNTQGALYLLVQWDKSSAILGNYAVDFNDTEFSAFSRSYYGGKIDYQSVANNPYGDARTKLVIYNAQVQQLPSHNEFLATGGSLYFLKYKNVIQGSDTVTIQVRDQTTGLVISSQTMVNGADYELDNSQGRILFWQPVGMLAQSSSIISNSLINGDPVYVVVDYQYAVSGLQTQGSQGVRVAQAVGNNVVVGGTYVQDNAGGQNYSLQGTDATLHVTKDATIKAEYAQTISQDQGSYVSTDGGITFNSISISNTATGKAYGIKGDARLFDNIGVKSYYKWIGADFGGTSSTSQQGKELMGLSMTWDMTPVTRLTASEDIQKLLANSNLQTTAQVGASETDTTMVQIVHTAERLKLTGQFQMTEVKSIVNGIVSTTNQKGAAMAGQAQYDLTDRIKLTLGQQVDVTNKNNTATTVGASVRATDHLTFNGQEVFSSTGRALTAGVTNQVSNRIAMTTDLTLTNLNTGEVDKTASVGIEGKVTNNIITTGNVALTGSSTGTTTTTATIGTKAKLSDSASLDISLGKTQVSTGIQSQTATAALNGTYQVDSNTSLTATTQISNGSTAQLSNGGTGSDALSIGTTGVTTSSIGLQATKKIDANTTRNASVSVGDSTSGEKTTTVGFGNNSQLDKELQAVTDNTFTFSPSSGYSDTSKYGIVRNTPSGQQLEANYTRASADQPTTITQSNIFGLSGDVNDKVALNGSIERGKVQNLDTSTTTRTDFTLGSGYVLKDTETAEVRLKNSIKLEYRIDKGIGTDSLHQYVIYDALDGKLTDNLSANVKFDYSKTKDTTTGATAERHEEIILGMAYRPVSFDNLNLIGEYTYQEGFGGGTQQADALNTNVLNTISQVISAEGIYDVTDQLQLAEKIALRIQNEQVSGFQFTQTHTWLVIHRLNYKIDRNWILSGEFRDLTQVEAKDNKLGFLLEATHEINQNAELGIGWNFTKYNDNLSNLSYTAQGPFVRMTGKFYDRTPEEKARDRARWLDQRINVWAWALIKKELSKKDSKIVLELNRMFALAKRARATGHLELSRQIYKDIISAGQMMYDEASEYIRSRITIEEQLKQDDKTAREYFKVGEYVKARKIWEKVVEDASKNVVK